MWLWRNSCCIYRSDVVKENWCINGHYLFSVSQLLSHNRKFGGMALLCWFDKECATIE